MREQAVHQDLRARDTTGIPTFEGLPWTELVPSTIAGHTHVSVAAGLADHATLRRRRTLIALVMAMCVTVVALSAVVHSRVHRGAVAPPGVGRCELQDNTGLPRDPAACRP